MTTQRTVAELCGERSLTPEQLAELAGLDRRRVVAIISGNWTPSPQERDQVAAVFGLQRDQIAWDHRSSVSHLYGHGPQFGRSP